jgi:hypothetical protein
MPPNAFGRWEAFSWCVWQLVCDNLGGKGRTRLWCGSLGWGQNDGRAIERRDADCRRLVDSSVDPSRVSSLVLGRVCRRFTPSVLVFGQRNLVYLPRRAPPISAT